MHVARSHLSCAAARLGFLCSRAKGSRALLTSLSLKLRDQPCRSPGGGSESPTQAPVPGRFSGPLARACTDLATNWQGPSDVFPATHRSRGNRSLVLLESKSGIVITSACTAGSGHQRKPIYAVSCFPFLPRLRHVFIWRPLHAAGLLPQLPQNSALGEEKF